jgi:hypothetical protein
MDLQRLTRSEGIWSRIRVLSGTGAVSGNLKISPSTLGAGCRMMLGLFPRRYRTDRALQDAVLRAFVVTVIPGADSTEANLVRMYHDNDYPFALFSGFLVYDLVSRAEKLQGTRAFDRLDLPQRTAVIEDGLSSNDIVSRLYRAAMLMAQVSYFAGIYDADRGCAMIEFPGRNNGYAREDISYPHAATYFGTEMTPDGNPP